jgi:16S rRNA (cytosine1402-N4)-methyltransferase
VVNTLKASDLARIFGLLGEERHAGRIARMIERRRAAKPFATTLDLAQSIADLVGFPPRERIHPATRVFQALRIYVNDELGELARALLGAERALRPGGRLVVVTFHSLEDRMVKRFIADRSAAPAVSRHMPEQASAAPTFEKMGGVVTADEDEIAVNPRARSAKLRAARRTVATSSHGDLEAFGLPRLPQLRPAAER